MEKKLIITEGRWSACD